jgi:hypothetical protein
MEMRGEGADMAGEGKGVGDVYEQLMRCSRWERRKCERLNRDLSK